MMFMKSFLVAATLAVAALAQTISIASPADGATVSAGSTITVEVDKPNSLSSSQEVVLLISMLPCEPESCIDPASALGTVLYSGRYNPQYSSPPDQKPPHQVFDLEVPAWFRTGKATLSVTHLALIGAGPAPILEYKTVTVNFVDHAKRVRRQRAPIGMDA
ncbi:hypothetical protein JAAARDRAFT_42009 [Jaapia argillacea MUCL 33604]|uniref:Phosphatidylglycerol/phosphatidylinositol transfer protein n=1 Tax=Jaapia argillacea MUCL 33604 TaxID=933084 RepID=A0A067PJB4_9AGAM|nr:hypothetical protein JAAARDRAFT_42009 [Jaapia argillacea MUCL 33604]